MEISKALNSSVNVEPTSGPFRESEPLRESELKTAIDVLERIHGERGQLLQFSHEQQTRLLQLAGQVAHPGRTARRQLQRASRRQRQAERSEQKQRDESLLEHTGIRQLRQSSVRHLGAPPRPDERPPRPPAGAAVHDQHFVQSLEVPRNCYICKQDFDRVHFFYDSMCPECAEFNWSKRQQTACLDGRVALLTGGRVKIGFETGLKLLRAGASLVVTTRFPRDAACRFAAQEDSAQWLERLQIYGLDLRHTPSVEALAEHLEQTLPRLDFILNNACQTVRRPPAFYEHLLAAERRLAAALPAEVSQVLQPYQQLLDQQRLPSLPAAAQTAAPETVATPQTAGETLSAAVAHSLAGIHRAAELSQVALLPEDGRSGERFFPAGEYDRDWQQVDLRDKNSWRLKLAEVATVELLEVHLVNAVAPFILNARLQPLMLRHPSRDKHIVNVSAMEGVFYRAFKRDTHPHTNMAKAALNMLTRTSAADYIQHGIHMNSVDTGWITDEDPLEITQRKQREQGFRTPLDTIDAAARICDPIFDGFNSGQHQWGKFLKDYQVSNW